MEKEPYSQVPDESLDELARQRDSVNTGENEMRQKNDERPLDVDHGGNVSTQQLLQETTKQRLAGANASVTQVHPIAESETTQGLKVSLSQEKLHNNYKKGENPGSLSSDNRNGGASALASDQRLLASQGSGDNLDSHIELTVPARRPDSKHVYRSRKSHQYEDADSQVSDHDDDVDSAVKAAQKKIERRLERNFMDYNASHFNHLRANQSFKNYKNVFQNLLKATHIYTELDVVNIQITYDSSTAIVVLKRTEYEYHIKMWDLVTLEETFEEIIGGQPHQYIKMNNIVQNSVGDKFALTYIDDGKFRIRTFGFAKENRTQEEITETEFLVNEALGLDDSTMPNDGFADPYIVSHFIDDNRLFVGFFHNATCTHRHFIYNISEKKNEAPPCEFHIPDTSEENFPVDCFYNDEREEVYLFYRQGQAFTIPLSDISDFRFDKITDKDLGQMYLFDNKSLIVKSSSVVLFFELRPKFDKNQSRQEIDEYTEEPRWVQYHQLNVRGFIFYIKGNIRIQITAEDKIYIYVMNKQTLLDGSIIILPMLENVLTNYMGCTQMMFGPKVKYSITFRHNQPGFDVFRKKYQHSFKSLFVEENYNRSLAVEVPHLNAFLVTKQDKIHVYDSKTYSLKYQIDVELRKSESREPNQIVAMQLCSNKQYLAVISGKELILDRLQPEELFVFQLEGKYFLRQYQVDLAALPLFENVAMDFQFKSNEKKERTKLIFTRENQIFELNFVTQEVETVVKFKQENFDNSLKMQPKYLRMNEEQKIMIAASAEDAVMVNLETGVQADLVAANDIGSVQEIIYDHEDRAFYIMANKYRDMLGVFLLKVFEDSPEPEHTQFIIRWNTRLNIGDVNFYIMRNPDQGLKELTVSYCTIYANSHNVLVMDISGASEVHMIFRHESFHLWEQKINGILLQDSKDFVTVSQKGIQVLALGNIHKRRIVTRNNQEMMIHSLDSQNYLRLDPGNFLVFKCINEQKQVISIQQEYLRQDGGNNQNAQNVFEEVYNVNLSQITLRQLLLFQSLYVCKTNSQIVDLVNDQPNPQVFYDAFLELDLANMASILSFDSGTMRYLLQDKFDDYFTAEFPIFYKNKIQKGSSMAYDDPRYNSTNNQYFYRSAIDNALRNNQVRAVSYIINYIVKYQNNFSSSFLFLKNMAMIFDKGIKVCSLLESNVFKLQVASPNWPDVHTNDKLCLRPYNGSIFDIQNHYKAIFKEKEFDRDENQDKDKIFKIKYELNLLPQIGIHIKKVKNKNTYVNADISLMDLFVQADQLELFANETVQDYIQFKWEKFGRNLHLIGCSAHFFYVIMLGSYCNSVYVHNAIGYVPDDAAPESGGAFDARIVDEYAMRLSVGIIYSTLYDTTQMFRVGLSDYLNDPWNALDCLYIVTGITQVIIHRVLGPFHIACKITMVIVVSVAVMKTFFYLRIFDRLSPIVTMLTQVTKDLMNFLLFFVILIFGFSMITSILGLGNIAIDGAFKTEYAGTTGYPGEENSKVGLLLGNFFNVWRCAQGDFSFANSSIFLSDLENIVFWITFFMILVFTNIIFLNFVIAEAGNSYGKINEALSEYNLKESSALIDEAESMIPTCIRSEDWYPKYIIKRVTDS